VWLDVDILFFSVWDVILVWCSSSYLMMRLLVVSSSCEVLALFMLVGWLFSGAFVVMVFIVVVVVFIIVCLCVFGFVMLMVLFVGIGCGV